MKLLGTLLCLLMAEHAVARTGVPFLSSSRLPSAWAVRGGDQESATDEPSLEDKVHAAMKKLGISPPPPPPPSDDIDEGDDEGCVDGVCPMPEQPASAVKPSEDPAEMCSRLAAEMNVDKSMVWAAMAATSVDGDSGAREFDENAAREMLQQEVNVISQVTENSPEVQQLVSEGFDLFLSRRALAFADMNMDDARAILLADQMDAEEEEAEAQAAEAAAAAAAQQPAEPKPEPFKTVSVKADFDPTKITPEAEAEAAAAAKPNLNAGSPTPAAKSDVVFDATASDIQKLVLESPVPVLLDVYADWCGPCKVLGPALEEMAIKSGGAFRLVKVNSDNERAVSGALEVTALPTIFGISNGKIRNMFQGMPKSEEAMKSFMMGLLAPGASFDPPVTVTEQEKYDELSTKLVKMAGAASFSFAARERLQDRIMARLDELAHKQAGVLEAEQAAQTIRSLLSNIIRDPFETKYRSANLSNKILSTRVAQYPAAVAILKSCGFVDSGDGKMAVGTGMKILNVAPLTVARDCIDKWIDQTRYEVAKASRQRKDEEDRKQLLAERAANGYYDQEESEEEEEEEVDPDACTLKLRLDGKKKVHTLELHADEPLRAILDKLPASAKGKDVRITCVARKLVVESSSKKMKKSLRKLGLAPAASLVVKVLDGDSEKEEKKASSLSERAKAKKQKKKGSHTMQSIGIYAKDDNNKSELIDGGGGVWYEHDVTDDEGEEEAAEDQAEENKEEEDKEEDASGDDESMSQE